MTAHEIVDLEKTKPVKVYELSEQSAVGPWTQQQYVAPYQQTGYYNSSSLSEIPQAAFHHMQTVMANSLNKEEDSRHIQPM